ncbi:hypothetical protein [Bdellovibrio sp. HCB274]|uniref:hypothetical protein n=1 Tax=Bdellovibrio sp. HCB274 TaxID=3394361 RepID=UPI0039B5DE39
MKSNRWLWGVGLFSVTLLCLLFLPGLREASFLIDDNILFNQKYLNTPWSLSSFKTLVTPGNSPDYYPLRDLTVWIDWSLAKDLMSDTTVPKLQNLVWFLGAVLWVGLILFKFTSDATLSVLLSAAWLFHPFHLESLSWISARKDLMSLFFILMAAYFLVSHFKSAIQGKAGLTWMVLSFVLCVLCKATFLAMPFAFLIWYLWKVRKESLRLDRNLIYACGAASAISVVFVLINVWNYSESNYLQMNEFWNERVLSVIAALGRNIVGMFVPFFNAIDFEPWGGWYKYNKIFIPVGIVGALLFFGGLIFGLIYSTSLLLVISLIGAILLMTPGFNPNHRNYYSIRYFEPVFLILWIALGLWLARFKDRNRISACLLFFFILTHWYDASNWHSNFEIAKKSKLVSPKDPSVQNLLLTEYHNLNIWGRLSQTEYSEFESLYRDLLTACIESKTMNGRCLSFYAHLQQFTSVFETSSVKRQEILRRALAKTIEIKKITFSEVASSEIAWSIFNFKVDVDGVFDVEALREFFFQHQYINIDTYRVKYLIFRCLDIGEADSQSLYKDWQSQNLIRKAEVNEFISSLKRDSLRQTAQNCFKTPK